MNTLVSAGGTRSLPARDARPLSDAALQALRWGLVIILTAAATALLSQGSRMFEAEVASQIASGGLPRNLAAAAPVEEDPFLQQKRDAKFEELPAQF